MLKPRQGKSLLILAPSQIVALFLAIRRDCEHRVRHLLRPIPFYNCCLESKTGRIRLPVKYGEIIANNLKKRGWNWGCVSALDRERQTIWIADAHRDDGKHFVARSDE